MSHELTKTIARRAADAAWQRIFRGDGIDIGCGRWPLDKMRGWFPGITSCRSWDKPQGDAQLMKGLAPASFDFVHSSHCLEHLVDAKAALRRWWELVKPGGCLIVAVPDEDLYEQGVYPSTFNREHKWTFSILKEKSWSPVHLDLLPLVLDLKPGRLLRISLQDGGYPYEEGERRDHSLLPWVEMQLEAVVQKLEERTELTVQTETTPQEQPLTSMPAKAPEVPGSPHELDDELASKVEDIGLRVHRPDFDRHVRRWQEVRSRLAEDPDPYLPDSDSNYLIRLGHHGAAHLGDTICTSSLPERLTQEKFFRVEVIRYRTTLNVFANNPFVMGFGAHGFTNIQHKRVKAVGHVIQRLEWAFRLEPQVWPRGRLYFSDAERKEAVNMRTRLSAHLGSKALAVMSCASITHQDKYAWAPWEKLVKLLVGLGYVVVHPVITGNQPLRDIAEVAAKLPPDPVVPGAVRVENLSCRQYMALIAGADLYLGAESGGAHVAASAQVPALVVMQSGYDYSQFDPSFNGPPRLFHWLYPQQYYLLPS